MKKTRLAFLLLLIPGTSAVPADAVAQNDARFHVELDYGYHAGLSESLNHYNFKSQGTLGGHSLTINALYNIRPDMTVGVGYGLTRFTRRYQGDNNTMPLYATFRYRPLATHRAFYAYTDLGYTLLNDRENHNFTGGFLGGIGVGYQLMFKRHFGLNFKLGYGIQQFARTPVVVSINEKTDQATGNTFIDATYDYRSLWRHSILFGLGLVF
jgi:hypothetical protein